MSVSSSPNNELAVSALPNPIAESGGETTPRPQSPVTQQDIAERLGVSQRLVSYALNGTGTVSDIMREKVRREAKLLGYRPNKAARALKSGRTQLIALYVPNLESVYGIRVLSLLRNLAEQSAYDLVIVGTRAKVLDSWPLDGFLHLDPRPSEMLADRTTDIPEVAMGCYPHLAHPSMDYAGLDLYIGARQAMQHLWDVGCERILFLSGIGLLEEDEPRADAYEESILAHGKKGERINVPSETLMREHSARVLREYIAEHGAPDGIFCGNDEFSVGACRALRAQGLRVPQDVKVVGCDGTPDSADHDPPISTIEFPYEELCRNAWDMLLRRIENPDLPPQRITLPTQLICRESSSR
jgi:DNA-binding LacI/PurR family transcriptional regulator